MTIQLPPALLAKLSSHFSNVESMDEDQIEDAIRFIEDDEQDDDDYDEIFADQYMSV